MTRTEKRKMKLLETAHLKTKADAASVEAHWQAFNEQLRKLLGARPARSEYGVSMAAETTLAAAERVTLGAKARADEAARVTAAHQAEIQRLARELEMSRVDHARSKSELDRRCAQLFSLSSALTGLSQVARS